METSDNLKKNQKANKKPIHINLEYLQKLSNGDNAFILEMISAFLVQIPLEIQNMKTHLANENWQLLRGVAHKIKPSLTFMGIKELEHVVALTEDYALNKKNLELLPELVQKIELVLTEVLKELEIEKNKFT